MNQVVLLLLSALILVSIDSVYLWSNQNMYKDLMDKVDILPGIGAWILITLGVYILAVSPSADLKTAILRGAVFGFTAYGIYNTTNLATQDKWTYGASAVDTLWGTTLCGAMAGIMYNMKA